MDIALIITVIGTGIATVGLIYAFLRNFKIDINSHIDRLEKRMNTFEQRMTSVEERMFYMATGKSLSQAILEEKMKKKEGE